jgi:uncharacterized membrane protein YbhN (UPF0104 family)
VRRDRRLTKIWRYVVTLVLLGLAVHLLLPQLASLEHALAVLRGMSRSLVRLAVGAQFTSYIGSGYLLQSGVSLLKQRICTDSVSATCERAEHL